MVLAASSDSGSGSLAGGLRRLFSLNRQTLVPLKGEAKGGIVGTRVA